MGLFQATAATGLYRLRAGDAVVNELLALQAGLDLIAQRLQSFERSSFPGLMSRAQLEQAFALCQLEVPEETRDETLRRALKALTAPCGCSLESIEAFLGKLGADITLEEQPDTRRVAVKGAVGGLLRDSKALCDLLAKLLPPDAVIEEALGVLSWEMFDGFDIPFGALDARDFTWTWLETSGHLLENETEGRDENGQQ